MLGTGTYEMSDRSSRGVDPERLRCLGKEASTRYFGREETLTDAVTGVLRDEGGLNPEHVRRVAEFANNYAFEWEFTKSAAPHRVIDFAGGPADSARILQELRSGSDSGVTITKTAGARLHASERFLPGADGVRLRAGGMQKTASAASPDYPYLNPHYELFELRELLKTARDQMRSKILTNQVVYDDAADAMCKVARELILDGHSPAEVARIYADRSPHSHFTKLALKTVSQEVQDVPAALMTKTASARQAINPEHPICTTFDHFVKVAAEMFTVLATSENLTERFEHVHERIKSVIS